MRAWQIQRHGEPDVALGLADVELPEPGPGELRIRVEAAALGLPDVFMSRGSYVFSPELPAIPGQEVAGLVTAVGKGTSTPVGARVMAVTAFFRGFGGLAEEALALEASSYPAPAEMPAAEAACFVIPFHTAYLGLVTRGRVQKGETLLVLGAAGGTGSAALQVGRALGARVIAIAGGAEKVEASLRFGAHLALDHRSEDWVEAVKRETDGRGADVIYDPVGGEAFDQALGCIASEGRLLSIGYASGRWSDASTRLLVGKNASVVGVFVAAYQKPFLTEVHDKLLALWRDGEITSLATREVAFDDVAGALGDLAARRAIGKWVVMPPPSQAGPGTPL